MEGIITALVSGGLTLIGVIITVFASSKHTEQKISVSQAITETKLEELTREVREHNNYARRVPVLEEKMEVANHRIKDLEDQRKER